MGKHKKTGKITLSESDLNYIQSVRDAEQAVQQQERRVQHARAKLNTENRELRAKLSHLRNVASAMPLFDGKFEPATAVET